MNANLLAYAALVIYQETTLPDRYYNYQDLIRRAAGQLNEIIWPSYLEEEARISVAFEAWEWLAARDLVWQWPLGNLNLAVGVTQGIPGGVGWQRIAAWQQAKTASEFFRLADDWTALEAQD